MSESEEPSSGSGNAEDCSKSTSAGASQSKNTKKKSKAKTDSAERKPAELDNNKGQMRIMKMMEKGGVSSNAATGPNRNNIETEAETRARLPIGMEKNYDNVDGPLIAGTFEKPIGSRDTTARCRQTTLTRL